MDLFRAEEGTATEEDKRFVPVAAAFKLRSWLCRVLAVDQTKSTLLLSLVEAEAKVMLIVSTKLEGKARKR